MQLTPIRCLSGLLAAPLAVVLLAVAASACGQVTGLSNDYLFDLLPDGAPAGDAKADGATGDGGKTDAPSRDAAADTGTDGAVCSTAQAANTELRLTQFNGSPGCTSCLSNDCCTDVDSCLNMNECRRALACRLDCTTKSGIDRDDCFATCNSNTGGNTTPASYTTGVGACVASGCSATTACAFQ